MSSLIHPAAVVHPTAVVHSTAEISKHATIGSDAKIWHQAQVREDATIGANCIIGKGAYIDFGVSIGSNSKLQNGVFVYHGVTIEEGVFLGPGVILTNDRSPRAINADGTQKSDSEWQVTPTLVKDGASIGARAVILPGVIIGEYAMVGAGAVVTRNVPAYGLVYGNPARLHGHVCCCGAVLSQTSQTSQTNASRWLCPKCQYQYEFCAERDTIQPASEPGDDFQHDSLDDSVPVTLPQYSTSTPPINPNS